MAGFLFWGPSRPTASRQRATLRRTGARKLQSPPACRSAIDALLFSLTPHDESRSEMRLPFVLWRSSRHPRRLLGSPDPERDRAVDRQIVYSSVRSPRAKLSAASPHRGRTRPASGRAASAGAPAHSVASEMRSNQAPDANVVPGDGCCRYNRPRRPCGDRARPRCHPIPGALRSSAERRSTTSPPPGVRHLRVVVRIRRRHPVRAGVRDVRSLLHLDFSGAANAHGAHRLPNVTTGDAASRSLGEPDGRSTTPSARTTSSADRSRRPSRSSMADGRSRRRR